MLGLQGQGERLFKMVLWTEDKERGDGCVQMEETQQVRDQLMLAQP